MGKLSTILLAVSCLSAFAQGNSPITGYNISSNVYQNNSLLAENSIELLPGFGVAAPGFSATLGKSYAVAGKWDGTYNWPIIAIHTHLLPNGKVITWQGHNDDTHDHTHPYIWDPATAILTEQPPVVDNIFCSGHTLLADGRLFVAGGHDMGISVYDDPINPNIPTGFYTGGLKISYTYDWTNNNWVKQANMGRNRWYPTVTTLSNGDVIAISGETEPRTKLGANLYRPELWNNSTWNWLTTTQADYNRQLPLYPMMFLTADGKVFNAGPNVRTGFLDVTNGGSWTDGPLHQRGRAVVPPNNYSYYERLWGTAAMYAPGQILLMGGLGGDVTKTTERINLTGSPLDFQSDAPMQYARFHANSTLLPDGTVLVTGGTATTSKSDYDAVLYPELWTPPASGSGNGSWTRLNPMSEPRLYHSTAVLLPDGRVLSAGGGEGGDYTNHPTAEVFSPPYLFKGARPVITAVPPRVGYGQPLTFNTPDAGTITAVSWIRLSSVTHSFNMNQRFQWLPIASRTTGSVTVTAPGSPTASPPDLTSCPPGHYLLFALRNGVPSEARIVAIGDNTCATLTLSTSKVAGECAVQALAQVDGTNVGSNFRWYIDGTYDPTYDGQTSVSVQLHNCYRQVTFAVEADATCGGTALARSAVVSINRLKSGIGFCPCQ